MPPQNIKIWSEHQTLTSRWIRGHGRRCGTASWRWTWGTREFHLWTCVYVILEQTYFCLWTCVDVVFEQTYFLRWVFVWHQQLVSDNMELWRRDLALEEELKQRPILGYYIRTEFKIWRFYPPLGCAIFEYQVMWAPACQGEKKHKGSCTYYVITFGGP